MKNAAQERKHLLQQLDAIYEASFDAIFTIDQGGKILASNEGAVQLFGYTRAELLQMSVEDLMPQAERLIERKSLADHGRTSLIKVLNRVRLVSGQRKDKAIFPFRLTVREISRADADLYICIAKDLSAVNKAQRKILDLRERLRTNNELLERQVLERTANLEQSITDLAVANQTLAREVREREAIALSLQRREIQLERLLRKERELSELRSGFVSMASHEFRTPLTAMLSSIEFIEMIIPEAPPLARKHIDRVRDSIGFLGNILEDFLHLSKLDVQGADLHIQAIDFKYFFIHLLDELDLLCKPGQKIIAELGEDLGSARHSANALRIVLTNLIGNAVKYSPEGARIRLLVARVDQRLALEVVDDGIGVDAGEIHLLFDRFYRAKNAAAFKGTGLGLDIAKGYALAMGGTIEAFSEGQGQGCTFRVNLPYQLPSPKAM